MKHVILLLFCITATNCAGNDIKMPENNKWEYLEFPPDRPMYCLPKEDVENIKKRIQECVKN